MDANVVHSYGDVTEYDAMLRQLHRRDSGDSSFGISNRRLSEQPTKKYRKDPVIPFKTRLVGTLTRMQKEGGHSSELLESISNLIGQDNA